MFNRACLARLSGFLGAILFATTAAWADTLVQVTSQAGQGATDSISWKQLGGDQSLLATSVTAKSATGTTHTVTFAGVESVVSVCGAPTRVNCSWTQGTG